MRELFFRSLRPPGQMWFLLLIFSFSYVLFIEFGVLLVNNLYGIDLAQGNEALTKADQPYVTDALKVLLFVQHLGLYILPALWFNQIFSFRGAKSFVFWGDKLEVSKVAIIILLMISAIPVINFLMALNQQMILPGFMKDVEQYIKKSEEDIGGFTEQIIAVKSVGGFLLNLLLIALIPALGEEFLFRGVIQKIVARWTGKVHLAIWLVAAIFSAMHMQFYGFLPRMLLGAMFGYVALWSGSIWYAVIAHFINNAVTLTLAYFIQTDQISKEVDSVSSLSEYLPIFGVGLAVSTVMLWYLRRISVFEKYRLEYVTHPALIIKLDEEPEDEDSEDTSEKQGE